ncbi:MAG: DNA ligase [Methylococcaceae bacterium]|jgi:DNA ligase-1
MTTTPHPPGLAGRIRALSMILLTVCCALATPSALGDSGPALLLAEIYRDEIDPADYWVSEKFDGVRAYWDGKQLLFRSGQPIHAPAWFIHGLPSRPLDGELWLARGQFERLSGIVRKAEPVDAEWRQLSYLLFELPDAEGNFSQRLAALHQLAANARLSWLKVVEQQRISDRRALKARLDEIVAAGGEGLMLHRADADYRTGRSTDLLKLKPYLDSEARVTGYIAGKGQHTGRMGALRVTDAEGRTFHLGNGFTDAQRDKPPAIGSLVTYRYRGLTQKGLPRFASFIRVRELP